VTKAQVMAFMKKDEEEGFEPCSDEVMAHFLDGLVFFKRGKDESRPSWRSNCLSPTTSC
jgi:uncharacterized protein YehS (DUF1456 family)